VSGRCRGGVSARLYIVAPPFFRLIFDHAAVWSKGTVVPHLSPSPALSADQVFVCAPLSHALSSHRFPGLAKILILTQTQGRQINKEYLRRLRTAVFSMEGSECQKLRDKVMSEMVLPKCVSFACDGRRTSLLLGFTNSIPSLSSSRLSVNQEHAQHSCVHTTKQTAWSLPPPRHGH